MKALYPGSFDPITNGHVDVIQRVAKLFDEVIVAVLNNQSKEEFIPLEDRLKLVKEVTKDIKNISVYKAMDKIIESQDECINLLTVAVECQPDSDLVKSLEKSFNEKLTLRTSGSENLDEKW